MLYYNYFIIVYIVYIHYTEYIKIKKLRRYSTQLFYISDLTCYVLGAAMLRGPRKLVYNALESVQMLALLYVSRHKSSAESA